VAGTQCGTGQNPIERLPKINLSDLLDKRTAEYTYRQEKREIQKSYKRDFERSRR